MTDGGRVEQLPIIVAGGGIAGLSLALQLLKLGQKVIVADQNSLGSGASRAASAYLEPRPGTGGLRDIEWASIEVWPAFAREIEVASGETVDYRTDGLIDISSTQNRRQPDDRASVEHLDQTALKSMEPSIAAHVKSGRYLAGVHWLDGRKLCRALGKAICKSGGKILENQPVERVKYSREGLVLFTPSQQLPASRAVLCAANGTNSVEGLPQDIPRCRPVRGVMVTLAMDPEAPIVRHVIKHQNGVLCPRSDGRLLIGPTHEEGETSTNVSESLIEQLIENAAQIVPSVRELECLEVTCGIRALVGDGLLRLGQSRSIPNLYYSLSHAGAGFLRAPVISSEFAQFVVNNDAACPLLDKYLARG